ncbi:MAG: V-type ATP synthase subunit F [Oscillospiraceae bacterium]|jgi:V/A-type H+-transporting ATPase subunit F|nr:V-type ATP synthase subunit F [Oscillospiraceae bacterium]
MTDASYKIAVLGDKDSVTAFKALGLETIECETAQEARGALRTLAAPDSHVAIIYVTEQLARVIPDEVAQMREVPVPAVILIPSKFGSLGLGMAALSDAAERATGTRMF